MRTHTFIDLWCFCLNMSSAEADAARGVGQVRFCLAGRTPGVGLAFLKLITADREITFSNGGPIKLKHAINMHLFSSV